MGKGGKKGAGELEVVGSKGGAERDKRENGKRKMERREKHTLRLALA